MRGYGGYIVVIVLVAAGYYAYAVNPTLYETVQMGSHTYRRNRIDDKWQVKVGNTWKDMKGGPALIDPGRRLDDVGIHNFEKKDPR